MLKKTILILSGGLDSTTLLYKLKAEGKQIKAISFLYGQRHYKEVMCAIAACGALKVKHKLIDVSFLSEVLSNSALTSDKIAVPKGHYQDKTMKSTVVPNRNMIFASIAIGIAVNDNHDEIALGVHAGDHDIYPDCRPEFVARLSKLAAIANYKPIGVYTPFIEKTKADIVAEGLKLNVDYSMTQTCYEGRDKACGKCGSCVERLEAFKLNNAKDPILYE